MCICKCINYILFIKIFPIDDAIFKMILPQFMSGTIICECSPRSYSIARQDFIIIKK